jgi:hypothetical protein
VRFFCSSRLPGSFSQPACRFVMEGVHGNGGVIRGYRRMRNSGTHRAPLRLLRCVEVVMQSSLPCHRPFSLVLHFSLHLQAPPFSWFLSALSSFGGRSPFGAEACCELWNDDSEEFAAHSKECPCWSLLPCPSIATSTVSFQTS